MDIKDLHNKFLECKSIVDIDSRSVRNGSMFFATKGENYAGNQFAEEALSKGAKFAVVDSNSISNNSKILRVKDSLQTLQKLANFHRLKTKSVLMCRSLPPVFFNAFAISVGASLFTNIAFSSSSSARSTAV